MFQRLGYIFLCQIDVSGIEPVAGLCIVSLQQFLVETEGFFVFSGHKVAPSDGSAGINRCLVEIFHLEEVGECLIIHSLGGETLAYLEQQVEIVRLDFLDFFKIFQCFRIVVHMLVALGQMSQRPYMVGLEQVGLLEGLSCFRVLLQLQQGESQFLHDFRIVGSFLSQIPEQVGSFLPVAF